MIELPFGDLRLFILTVLVSFIANFYIHVLPIVFILVFCIANIQLNKRIAYLSLPIDIEIGTFCIILMAYSYGVYYGIATVLCLTISEIVVIKRFELNQLFYILTYIVGVIFITSFLTVDIVLIGFFTVILLSTLNFFINKVVSPYSQLELFWLSFSNILCNLALLVSFASYAIKLMV